MVKISIIGMGRVGAIVSYEIARRDICKDLAVVDIVKPLAQGHADDINHALCKKSKTRVYAAESYHDISGSDVVVLAAGKPRTPDMKSRLDLAKLNSKIVKDVLDSAMDFFNEKTILITVTNPMDVMNFLAYTQSGLPREKVIGSGGMLDSMRLCFAISEELCVDRKKVEAYVLGEHGEGQVPIFSNIRIDGKRTDIEGNKRDVISRKVIEAGKSLIKKKGFTEFGPGFATAEMIESILLDKKHVIPSSVVLEGEYGQCNVSLGIPVELGKKGGKIIDWNLSKDENDKLETAGNKLRAFLRELKEN